MSGRGVRLTSRTGVHTGEVVAGEPGVELALPRTPGVVVYAPLGETPVDPDVVRNNAYRGIGTIKEIRDHIVRLRDTIGITYFCLRGPDVEKLGPIVTELTGR